MWEVGRELEEKNSFLILSSSQETCVQGYMPEGGKKETAMRVVRTCNSVYEVVSQSKGWFRGKKFVVTKRADHREPDPGLAYRAPEQLGPALGQQFEGDELTLQAGSQMVLRNKGNLVLRTTTVEAIEER